jgi:hypothetical protein
MDIIKRMLRVVAILVTGCATIVIAIPMFAFTIGFANQLADQAFAVGKTIAGK